MRPPKPVLPAEQDRYEGEEKTGIMSATSDHCRSPKILSVL